MKKTIQLIFIFISLVSCTRKDYTCACTGSVSPTQVQILEYKLFHYKEDEADVLCTRYAEHHKQTIPDFQCELK
jgi:hypothetical protein